MSNNNREPIWTASPSQIINVFPYLKYSILIGAIVYLSPLIYPYMPEVVSQFITIKSLGVVTAIIFLRMAWKYLEVKLNRYIVYQDEIIEKSGVISQRIDSTEMYRVKDFEIKKPWFLRLFGLGTLVAMTSDKSTPVIYIKAVRNVDGLASSFRAAVNESRKLNGVREID